MVTRIKYFEFLLPTLLFLMEINTTYDIYSSSAFFLFDSQGDRLSHFYSDGEYFDDSDAMI